MPQLNPGPWFAILLYAWLIFVVVIPSKVMAHLYPNDPAYQNAKNSPTPPWSWPWH
uniref:ATP synthase complex subunit 8 n=1 Tax=Ratabulus megacephalus TaxID=1633429 RepID=A0A679DZ77_9TELE|nr:ATPase subunits 8 [Ratabulus megacephalus]BBM90021.1 ATPase subunits 8 [Ratabulus megacephalus]